MFMKLFSHLSIIRGIGFLFVLTVFVHCEKDYSSAKPSETPISTVEDEKFAASGQAQTLSQTKTATRLNYNFEGNLVGNYIGSATDVANNDNLYAYTKKLAPRNGYALLVLEGFGFSIPSTAKIENIQVKARRFKTGRGTIKEYYATLVKNRERPDLPEWWEVYGVRWVTPGYFAAIETEVVYSQNGIGNNGGSGSQSYQWTAARINDPYFGVLFQLLPPEGSSVVVYYDLVEITVVYSLP